LSNYYDRYQRGQRIEVWSDLIALGEAVRQEPVFSDAVAVARETMTRARHNVETLIKRLDGIGYRFMTRQRALQGLAAHMEGFQELAAKQLESIRTNQLPGFESIEALMPGFTKGQFLAAAEQIAHGPQMQGLIQHLRAEGSADGPANSLDDPSIYTRASQRDAALENAERILGGPLPISLRAWSEAVSHVSFLGSHPILNPSTTMGFGAGARYTEQDAAQMEQMGIRVTAEPPAANDDLSTLPDPLVLLDVVAEVRDLRDPDCWDGDIFLIAPDISKADLAPCGIRLPDRSADLVFGDWKKGFFVEYLRRVFAWGGFPGWERYPNPPMDLIRELTHGLQPI
jgi:hypothetical protein